jgi:transposase
MTLPRDPRQYLEEAVQYRKKAAAALDSFELCESYLALARSYELLVDALTRREPSIFGRAASIHSYELTDFEWKVIEPLLPNKPRGIPRVDDRRVLNGILWILGTGAPWHALPKEFGRYSTCYSRFARWRKAGVWDRVLAALTKAYEGNMQIDSNSSSVHILHHAANSRDAPRSGIGLVGRRADD